MRVLEAIFIAITLISCILWLLPKVSIYLKIFFTLSAAILGILQCLLEGYRTAMLPAYVLVAGLLIYRVWRWRKPQVTRRRRKLLLVLLSLYILLAAILPLLLPVFQLEKPDGAFAIGTKSFAWDYRSSASPASGLPSSEHITLHVQFWYPAEQTTNNTTSYATNETLQSAAAETSMPAWLFDSLKLVKTDAVQDAPVARAQANYPVILFIPGEGVPALSYSEILQELASHGFIIASISAVEPALESSILTSQTLSDSAINAMWIPKIHSVLDHLEIVNRNQQEGGLLTGKLNLQQIGILGHSYGGAAIPLALLQEPRLKAGIDMDGIFFGASHITDGIHKPFLLMNSKASKQGYTVNEVGGEQKYQKYREVFARKQAVLQHGGYELTLDGIWHLGFSDFNHYSPILGLFSPLSQQQAYHIISGYSLAFFQKYLTGKSSSLLTTTNQPFPQATLTQEP